ncbi:GvpL/GvpF family gas vesicle protein [Chloroflexota bacterium]
MEEIFCAVLALHIAGKPVNKENIRVVLRNAGTSVNETALDAMAAFVESLATVRQEKVMVVDHRIIKFLTSELARRKVETKQLEALLEEIAKTASSMPEANKAWLKGITTSLEREKSPSAWEDAAEVRVIREDAKPVEKVLPSKPEANIQSEGRYVYGVATGSKEVRLGSIGIDDGEVYTIPYQDIVAIVHNCPSEPYQSCDDETVRNWVGIHQSVLDVAKGRFGVVIPLGFDTILRTEDDGASPEEVMRDWLRNDYERLHTLLGRIKGKDEYGVQVSYDSSMITKQVSEQSEEIRIIKEEMTTKSPGMAYFYRQKLEKAVKAEIEKLAERWFNDFYGKVRQHADDIVVEKTKKSDKEKVMLLNFSCLVAKEKVDSLGQVLEEINNMDGFSVHFSGPWPPYNFVAKPVVVVKEE